MATDGPGQIVHAHRLSRVFDVRTFIGKTFSQSTLTFTTLWANSADDDSMIFFLFFPENRIWHFMQIVSIGDNLHEMSNPVFWKK